MQVINNLNSLEEASKLFFNVIGPLWKANFAITSESRCRSIWRWHIDLFVSKWATNLRNFKLSPSNSHFYTLHVNDWKLFLFLFIILFAHFQLLFENNLLLNNLLFLKTGSDCDLSKKILSNQPQLAIYLNNMSASWLGSFTQGFKCCCLLIFVMFLFFHKPSRLKLEVFNHCDVITSSLTFSFSVQIIVCREFLLYLQYLPVLNGSSLIKWYGVCFPVFTFSIQQWFF